MSSPGTAKAQETNLCARDFWIALAVVLPLAAVIAPYRAIHVPQMFIAAVAAMGGLLCFKLAIEDPEQLLFVFLLYIPFQKVLPGDFGGVARAVNFTNGFLVLLFMGWLARVKMSAGTQRDNRWTLLDFAVMAFLAILTISMTAEAMRETGDVRYETLSDLKRWLTPFAVYFLVTAIARSTRAVKKMLLAVIITTAVIGLLGVKQFWMDMGGGSRQNIDEIRIEVTSGPSNLGALFAYYLPYIVALWLSNFGRAAYWPLVFPIAWCMDSLRTTFSRGAAVAFFAGVTAVVWKKSKLLFLVMAMLVVAVAQSGDITLPYSIFGRMTSTYRADRPGDTITDKLDESARTRVVIWKGGLEMVREHALFGVGYGKFPSRIGEYAPEVAGKDPHNNFLKIAAEMGIPALVSFVLLLLICLWRSYRIYGKVDDALLKAMLLGYMGSVVGLMVANMFGSRLDSDEITTQFWAMTGAVVLLERYVRRGQREDWEVAPELEERQVEAGGVDHADT